ncbi:MAG: hypothetical protein AMXMBFR25_19930 [Lysobacterales bacterium]
MKLNTMTPIGAITPRQGLVEMKLQEPKHSSVIASEIQRAIGMLQGQSPPVCRIRATLAMQTRSKRTDHEGTWACGP